MTRLQLLLPRTLGMASDGTIARFFVLSGSTFVSSFLGFFLVIVIIRASGAGALGEFSFGLTVTSYAIVAATIGTEYHAIKLTAGRAGDLRVLVPSVVLLRIVLAVPIYLLIVTLALNLAVLSPYKDVLLILGLSLPINAFNIIWFPQGINRAGIVAVCNVTAPLITIVFSLAAAALGFGVPAFAASKVAADLFVTALLICLVRHDLQGLDWPSGWRTVRQLANASAPIGGSQMLRTLALSSDLLVLGFFVPAVGVGHYSAAFRIFSLLTAVGTMYHLVIIPAFSQHAEDHVLLGRELQVAVRRTLLGSLPVALLICLTAPWVLALGFGKDFSNAACALQLLAVAAVANILSRPYRQVLLTIGLQRTDFWLNAAASAVHLVLKICLCYFFGITGVATGTALGEVVLTLLTLKAAHWGLARDASPSP